MAAFAVFRLFAIICAFKGPAGIVAVFIVWPSICSEKREFGCGGSGSGSTYSASSSWASVTLRRIVSVNSSPDEAVYFTSTS